MAISRPLLLALLGAALLAVTFFAVQGARTTTQDPAAPAATPSPAPVEEQAAKAPEPVETSGMTAEEATEAAFAGAEVRSAQVDVRFAVTQSRGSAQDGSARLTGSFESKGAGKMPVFDLDLTVNAGGQKLRAGAVSLGDRAFLTRGDDAYAVPGPLWKAFTSARAKQANLSRDAQSDAPSALLGVNTEGWLDNSKVEGSETIDGVSTTHVSADVDVVTITSSILPLAQQSGTTLPPNFSETVAKEVKEAQLDVYVGEDRILRRLSLDVELRTSTLTLALNLSEVNEPQRIAVPDQIVRKPASQMGEEQSVIASTMLAGGALILDPPAESATTEGFDLEASIVSLRSTNNPARAIRAVKAGKKVVIFFENPRGLDDRTMERSLRSVARRSKVLFLTDDVAAVDRYGDLVQNLAISQAPSTVIIDRKGRARVIEGFVDAGTLRQAVADAR